MVSQLEKSLHPGGRQGERNPGYQECEFVSVTLIPAPSPPSHETNTSLLWFYEFLKTVPHIMKRKAGNEISNTKQ